MTMNKVVLLACGSFNPPTNMHLRMFEIARDHLHRLENCTVIGGVMSPVHDAYGKNGLESSTHRVKMLELALQTTDWIKVSKWEVHQETWSRTKQTLQYHQNQVNAFLNSSNDYDENVPWIPDALRNGSCSNVQIKLLCGADLLESFATPGLWSTEDMEAIIGQYGLVVITRVNSNPLEFIYNSDLLTKYSRNIQIVTEWITNEISSTKIRRCIRRSESIKYLVPDSVIDYIYKFGLYGASNNKYLTPMSNSNSNYLIPSPSDVIMESPSPVNNRCLVICDTAFSRKSSNDFNSLDTIARTNTINMIKHPGQAVKIVSDAKGEHKIIREPPETNIKVCNNDEQHSQPPPTTSTQMKTSKSFTNFVEVKNSMKVCKSNADLKECKSCDENLIKFIFTRHGIQVISDVETIV